MKVSILLFAVMVTAFVAVALGSSHHHRHKRHEQCVEKCLTRVGLDHMCQVACKNKLALPDVEVFVDGQRIQPRNSPLSDQALEMNNVNFDKAFYTTPEAFTEILDFKGELLKQFYNTASSKFNTPQRSYAPGTMLHVMKVPIPLTDPQISNQEFMDKLIDVVPKSSTEYEPASSLSFSEAYKDFLLNVHVGDAAESQVEKDRIAAQEAKIEQVLTEYVQLSDKCYSEYQVHIKNKVLSPISYTLEEYSPSNANCVAADAKLAEHTRLSDEIAKWMDRINPYNHLFSAIGKLSIKSYTWNYAKDEIQQFVDFHRSMESKGVVPADSEFSIPVSFSRNSFNFNYFGGSSASFKEDDITGTLTFSGLGWKESAISPNTNWFDMHALQSFKGSQLNKQKDYFGADGILTRIPSYVLVAYKPVLKVKISRSMKEGFSNTAESMQLRPFETGPFVYTRVDIKTNNGAKLQEEFEMILSTSISQPQIIAFKSTPVVHLPAAPAPPVPEYLSLLNKQILPISVHDTNIKATGGNGAGAVSASDHGLASAWVPLDAGNNKVYLMNANYLTYLSCEGATATGLSRTSTPEKFTMIKVGDKWVFRSHNGGYVQTSTAAGHAISCNGESVSSVSSFSLRVENPAFIQFRNRQVRIKSYNGLYIASSSGEGGHASLTSSTAESTIWRLVYLGERKVAFLSTTYNRYLTSPADTVNRRCNYFLWWQTNCWDEVHPAYGMSSSGLGACGQHYLIEEGGTVGIRNVCQGRHLVARGDNLIGISSGFDGTTKFTLELVA